MNKAIIKIPIKDMSRKEWLIARNAGLGGSDIGSIFGIDKYKPAIKLFHQKIGYWDTDEEDNIAAYSGRVGEDHIYKYYWKYWSPENESTEEFLHNANKDNVIRRAKHIYAMLKNPKYPWLLANIDFEINKWNGQPNGILELKMPSSMHWNTYDAGLPPGYIFQIQMYMLVTGYSFGELFALKDGRYPELFRFEANKEIQEAIIEKTKDFWDKVLKGREIVQNKSLSDEEKQALLAPLEPEPESSDAYEDYMKDRFKQDAFSNTIIASSEIEGARTDYWVEHKRKDDADKAKQLEKNKIMGFMVENRVDAVTLADETLIKMIKNEKGSVRLTVPKIKN